MTNLDPRSMIALAGFMSAVMAMVLLFMRRHYPPRIRGVGVWAAAPLLWLLSTVLFGARGAIPAAARRCGDKHVQGIEQGFGLGPGGQGERSTSGSAEARLMW